MEDGETTYAYHLMYKRIMLPWDFANLPLRKKALIMAFVDKYISDEKKEASKIKSGRGSRRR